MALINQMITLQRPSVSPGAAQYGAAATSSVTGWIFTPSRPRSTRLWSLSSANGGLSPTEPTVPVAFNQPGISTNLVGGFALEYCRTLCKRGATGRLLLRAKRGGIFCACVVESAVGEIRSFREHATPGPAVPKQCPYPGARPAPLLWLQGCFTFAVTRPARVTVWRCDMQTSPTKSIKRPLLTLVSSGLLMIAPLARGRADSQSALNPTAKSHMS
jgi:hypothetical protein